VSTPIERSTPEEAARSGLAWAAWPCDLCTPVRAYLALRARGRTACLLESVEGPARLARYSFLGVDPSASFRARAGASRLRDERGERAVPGTTLEAFRSVQRPFESPLPRGLPPFVGGWIGWFSFEWSSELEPSVPRVADGAEPWDVACFELYENVLAFDHAAQKVYVLARTRSQTFSATMDRVEAIADDAMAQIPLSSGHFRLEGEMKSCTPSGEYESGVERLRRDIAAGEIFQAVLSQRFEQSFQGDPFTLYRVLRLQNPSPHMFFFECEGITLIGSSPERLVSVRDRRAENRPIAGTRPRGADAAADERLAAELRGDPKERAEHDMLVDLARNDLGRVARTGTVKVREHALLERFARVQHLVSRVECELASGRDALDALAASFPAGTVSGAPKVRALQLLAQIERDARGPYAGAFGYVDGHGNLDMALILRSFVARSKKLSVQAGAGVVFDSIPEREREETLHKAGALFEAARLAGSDAFRGTDTAAIPTASPIVAGRRA
jgi:anthranilate synthase component 1